ncbi:MAG: polysaccharide biosynthesis protein [Clostridiales bacterium]|jgi:stage V sporulation protein B|nr:polysaccharide biosynthesis protein [Clostridiales bacterium]
MIRLRSFAAQTAALAGAGLLTRLIGFLYRLPLTDMIGNVGNGIYGASYNLYMFFLIMSSAGLPVAVAKMTSHRLALGKNADARAVFRTSLAVTAVLGLLSSMALWFGARAMADAVESPRSFYAIRTLSPTVFIVSVMAVFRGYFQGMGSASPTALSQIVEQVFNAVFSVFLCYALMKGDGDATLGAAGGTAGTGVGALAGLFTVFIIYIKAAPKKRPTEPATERQLSVILELVRTAGPIIIGAAIFSVANLIDMVMVNGLLLKAGYGRSDTDAMYGLLTGKYVTLTTLPVSISSAVATAAVPNIARFAALGDKVKLTERINVALRLSMTLSIPAAAGIGVLGQPILRLLFPSYPDGGYLLQLGAISVVFLALSQIAAGILQGAGYAYIPAIAAFFGAAMKIPLNYWLIPKKTVTVFGLVFPMNVAGAVISSIACYAVAAVVDMVVLKKVMGKDQRIDARRSFFLPVASSAVMALICHFTYRALFNISDNNTASCLIAIFFGVASYFACLYLIGGLEKEDLVPFVKKRAR